jgi:hypothetical protein
LIRAAAFVWLIIGLLVPAGEISAIAIGVVPSDEIGYLLLGSLFTALIFTAPMALLAYWIGVKRSRRAALVGAIIGLPIGAYMTVFGLAMASGTATSATDLVTGIIAAAIFLLPGVLSGLAAREIRTGGQPETADGGRRA